MIPSIPPISGSWSASFLNRFALTIEELVSNFVLRVPFCGESERKSTSCCGVAFRSPLLKADLFAGDNKPGEFSFLKST